MRFWAVTFALLLTGCAGIGAALQYDDVMVMHFEAMDHDWRFFDKPAEGRLMITPSYGVAAVNGFLSGLTLGAADTDIPKSDYQAAVESWLKASGRDCSVTDGYKLIRPQWEFKYVCKPTAAAAGIVPLPAPVASPAATAVPMPLALPPQRPCTPNEAVQKRIAIENGYTLIPNCS